MTVENHTLQPPNWSIHRFVVLDPSGKWAEPIRRQLAEFNSVSTGLSDIQFESCGSSRDVLLLAELANTIGLILFLDGMETDCLNLLRRLQHQGPAILGIGTDAHKPLIPVLVESGLSMVFTEVKNDIPIARWCHNVLQNSLH